MKKLFIIFSSILITLSIIFFVCPRPYRRINRRYIRLDGRYNE